MKMSMLIKAEEIIVDNTEYNSDEADEMHLALEDSGGENYHQTYQEQDIMTSPHHDDVNVTSAPNTPSSKNQDPVTKTMMENEKRIRREIANSNERRRMQSINAGFQSLRSLLPRHEGEKLSKAAILQQTAQYILDLEREKTTLLSQNSQLKRQHCQHESTGGNCNGNINQTGINKITTDTEIVVTTAAGTIAPGQLKKRKLADNIISMQTISDSSDEGLGSMSPEPMTLIATSAIAAGNITSIGIQQQQPQQQQIQTKPATAYISSTAKEVNELRARLENERKRRHLTEERLRQLERQVYQTTTTNNNQYIQREVIEHTDNIRDDDITTMIINEQPQQEQHHQQQQQQQIHHLQSQQQQQQIHHHHHQHRQQTQTLKIDPIKLQVVEIDSLPSVGQTQVVVCSSIEEMQDDEADNIINDMNIREEVIMTDENTEIVEVPSRLQPILEAAIKAEPKVEVERINATISKIKGETPNDDNNDCIGSGGNNSNSTGGNGNGNGGSCKRMYLTSTSRQNLETIVEAIRHLEGDHLFGDNIATIEQQQQHKKLQQQPQQQQLQQDVPLALTTATTTTAALQTNLPKLQQKSQRNLTKDLSPFLQLKKPTNITIITGKTLNNNSSSNNNNMINSNNLSLSNNNQNINNSNTIITTNSTIVVSSNNIINASIIKPENITTSAPPPPVPTSLITATQLKQCRPGVIVAKQTS